MNYKLLPNNCKKSMYSTTTVYNSKQYLHYNAQNSIIEKRIVTALYIQY